MGFLSGLFGTYSEKQIRKIEPVAQKIEALAPKYSEMDDAALKAQTDILKKRLFIGGIVIHQGRIAEMRTGEGKTLVATLPAYLNALTGKGVHVVTVNDYLAKRDSEWMGNVYRFLGLSVGLILQGMNTKERQEAYNLRHQQRARVRLPARQHGRL